VVGDGEADAGHGEEEEGGRELDREEGEEAPLEGGGGAEEGAVLLGLESRSAKAEVSSATENGVKSKCLVERVATEPSNVGGQTPPTIERDGAELIGHNGRSFSVEYGLLAGGMADATAEEG
jgi:hypothetical protein